MNSPMRSPIVVLMSLLATIVPTSFMLSCDEDGEAGSDADSKGSDIEVDSSGSIYEHGSSLQQCLCWPNGDECTFPDEPGYAYDETKRCPEDEICDGGYEVLAYPGLGYGKCGLPCRFAGDESAPLCPEGWRCAEGAVTWGFEHQYQVDIAICVRAFNNE